jgi:hemerythrin-like domain-containing protein
MASEFESRRQALLFAASAVGFGVVTSCKGGEAEVTPGEDLMQEHGLIERVLLVYDEAARRLEQNEALDLGIVTSAAALVRRFVEDYHEKSEEQFVFPPLQSAGKQTDLIAVLLRQHRRGREISEEVIRLAKAGSATAELSRLLRAFARMYRPHAAREDTVLFPAFRSITSESAYRELGERFEAEEHARLGEHGFESAVVEIASLEARLGIGELASFTPP